MVKKKRRGFLPGMAPSAPYVKGSSTSKAAAASILPVLNEQQAAVFKLIKSSGKVGMTDEECQDAGFIKPNAQRPRRIELAEKGLIVKAGKRKTKSGRYAQVWIAKEFAS